MREGIRRGCAIAAAGLLAALVGAGQATATADVHPAGTPGKKAPAPAEQVPGMDVSGHQKNVDWAAAYRDGARFAYVKATEGTGYRNPYFAQQYNGSHDVGMIRGAYHFALPDRSAAAVQADFFVDHGGAWSADGKTMPPMLDIEYNPYGDKCFGLSQPQLTGWIKEFSDRVHARTTRWPMIYTTTDWWRTCTGDSAGFGDTNPLFIARYAESAGPLPNNWKFYTLWQYSDKGTYPGDQNVFNGTMERLRDLAGAQPVKSEPPSSSAPPSSSSSSAPPSSSSASAPPVSSTSGAPPAPDAAATPADRAGTPGLIWANPKPAAVPPPTVLHKAKAAKPTTSSSPTSSTPAPDLPVQTLIAAPPPRAEAAQPERAPQGQPPAAAPESAVAAEAGQAELAQTGARPARMIVFGVSVILLGACVLVLLRALAGRRRAR